MCPWHVLSLVLSRDSKEVLAEGVGSEQEPFVMWDISADEGLKHCTDSKGNQIP